MKANRVFYSRVRIIYTIYLLVDGPIDRRLCHLLNLVLIMWHHLHLLHIVTRFRLILIKFKIVLNFILTMLKDWLRLVYARRVNLKELLILIKKINCLLSCSRFVRGNLHQVGWNRWNLSLIIIQSKWKNIWNHQIRALVLIVN